MTEEVRVPANADTLSKDLDDHADQTYRKAAVALYRRGYRMPDTPDRWQIDRLTGALAGAFAIGDWPEALHRLVNVAGLEVCCADPGEPPVPPSSTGASDA